MGEEELIDRLAGALALPGLFVLALVRLWAVLGGRVPGRILAPVALVLAKSLGTYLNPVGKVCVPVTVAQAVEDRKMQKEMDKYF